MTYFGFLLRFLLIPLTVLGTFLLIARHRGHSLPPAWRTWPAWGVVGAHVFVAILYTTPWDNYLVATRVWWYDPALVTGLTLGYVPIEEYTFFILQTLLIGTWVIWLLIHLLPSRNEYREPLKNRLRGWSAAIVTGIWAASTIILLSGWRPATYLTLILSWALLPVLLQLAFGADILWRYRRIVVWGIIPPTIYLGLADALAITAGTWSISPDQTLGILLGGVLPLEEFLFFLMTNVLVVLGVILVLAPESHARVEQFRQARPVRQDRAGPLP